MNRLMLALFIVLVNGCAGLQPQIVYIADNMKKTKCDASMYDKMVVDAMFKPIESYSAEEMKKAEEMSGYSECTSTSPDLDSRLTICKKPVLYKMFMSKKQANCHKFMVDNSLIQKLYLLKFVTTAFNLSTIFYSDDLKIINVV